MAWPIWQRRLGLAALLAGFGLPGCTTTDFDGGLDEHLVNSARGNFATDEVSGGIVPPAVSHFSVESLTASRQTPALDPSAVALSRSVETAVVRSERSPASRKSQTEGKPPATLGASDPAVVQTGAILPANPTVPVPPAPEPETPAPAKLSDGSGMAVATPAEASLVAPLLPDGKPIDLGSALALVAGQNPEVNFARAQVREAYARLDAAEVLWVPDLQAGVNYHRHEGQLQDVGGAIVDINRSSLNAGLGAGATGAGTVPYPGLVIDIDAADAIFGPEIARRAAWASRHAVDAEVNDQLLAVALAYLGLIEADQRVSIARETLANAEDLAETTTSFAETGQGLQADAQRATTELSLRRNELLRAEEEAAVASARLAELVRLSPTERLVPVEAVPLPIDLVSADCEPRDLVAQALGRRPELRQQRALVEEAMLRLRQEKYAPLIPSVLVGASYSGFGGGLGGTVSDFNDRADFDAVAVWEMRNLGFGERAARDTASARVDQNRYRQLRTMDVVAREVVEAHAQVLARGRQIAVAEEAVRAAQESYRLNRERISEGQGLPIETVQAIQSLDAARRDHVRSVTDYNEAQFRLHRALGWPIQ